MVKSKDKKADDGLEEVRFMVRSDFLDEVYRFMGMSYMVGSFVPEHDPVQRLAVLVLGKSGRIASKKRKAIKSPVKMKAGSKSAVEYVKDQRR